MEITHSAKGRTGLAAGDGLAAEYCLNNKGILTNERLTKIIK